MLHRIIGLVLILGVLSPTFADDSPPFPKHVPPLLATAVVTDSESRVVDINGKELSRNQVLIRLAKETPVLVSVSGEMPDAYFLQLTNANALIILLGPRDGNPAPELLPAKKEAGAKPQAESEK